MPKMALRFCLRGRLFVDEWTDKTDKSRGGYAGCQGMIMIPGTARATG